MYKLISQIWSDAAKLGISLILLAELLILIALSLYGVEAFMWTLIILLLINGSVLWISKQ